MGHLAGMQNFLSEKVLLQCKLLILFYCKILANKALEEKLEAEVTQVDQKVVLELDQLVSDQQATLQVRIVPLFFFCFLPDVYFLSDIESFSFCRLMGSSIVGIEFIG